MRNWSWILEGSAADFLVVGDAVAEEKPKVPVPSGFIGNSNAAGQDGRLSWGRNEQRWIDPTAAAGKCKSLLPDKSVFCLEQRGTAQMKRRGRLIGSVLQGATILQSSLGAFLGNAAAIAAAGLLE